MVTKKRVDSWGVSDEFWQRVEPLIPVHERAADKAYVRRPGAGRDSAKASATSVRGCCVCTARGLPMEGITQGVIRQRQRSPQAIPRMGESRPVRGDLESRPCRVRPDGRHRLAMAARRWGHVQGSLGTRSGRPQSDRSGGKGSKQHLSVDGRGVPLSIVVTGANEHDVTQIDAVLQSVMVKRKTPPLRRNQPLCADAGYRGKSA